MASEAPPAEHGLLERSEELRRIESALARGVSGTGSLVVIEGPAGIGKTALLAAARSGAESRGMKVLAARGAELEREFAFGVVRQLFEPPLAQASAEEGTELLQGPAALAAEALALPGFSASGQALAAGPEPPFAVLHGLYWLCANLAASRPTCLIVDDAHWADSPSLRYLAFLLPRLDGLGAALVVAARPRESRGDAGLLATLATDPGAELIRIAPLTRTAVAQFVAERLGAEPEPAFVEACLRATRGTPFLMRELVSALREEAVAPTEAAAGLVQRIGAGTVGRSILLRLDRLPREAARLARAMAVLERAELWQAARLGGLSPEEAVDAADRLAAADILAPGRPLTFAHPIVRAGIYEALPAGDRAGGHRAAARMLADEHGANERVAEHLLATDPMADAWVVERLVAAARAAAQSGAPESAATYLRRALEEPPRSEDRAGLMLELGMSEASAGLDTWPSRLRAAMESATQDSARVAAATVLALALGRAQRSAEAVEVLDRAAALVDPAEVILAARLEAATVGVGMIDVQTAAAVSRRRDAVRRRAGADPDAPPEALAVSAFTAVLTNEPRAEAIALATRALAAGREALAHRTDRPWYAQATWFSQTTVSLVVAEDYERVVPLLDESIARARATADSGRFAVGLAHRGWVALRRGHLLEATADTETALAAAELPAPTFYRVLNAAILVDALVEQGQLAAARRALAPMDERTETGSLTAVMLRFARGRLRIAEGDLVGGLGDLLAAGAVTTRSLVTCPSFLPWRSYAAHAHLALGDVDAARRLAEEELALARAFAAPRSLGIALCTAGVARGGDAGEALLRDAVATLAETEAALDRARALTDLGALLRRRNRRREARELLRQGLDIAHRAGARPLAARAETELRATGARPRRAVLAGLDSLTASERRVAELAAQGMTNREIAQALFVTARTVEGHLTNVFRKLDLESREGLAQTINPPVPVA